MKITEYEHYIDRLATEFPELKENSIEKIVKHGLDYILKYRKRQVDFYIRDDKNLNFYMYLGDITTTSEDRNKIHLKKKIRKIRHMYILDKNEFDGYYYFGLTNKQNEEYIKSNVIKKNIYCQILQEAQIRGDIKHIYRVKMEYKSKWHFIVENDSIVAEYYQIREGKNFKSII